MERLGHPKLTREPLEVLEAVVDGTWSSSEARRTLLSITTRLTYLNLTPNKTKNASNVTQLKFMSQKVVRFLLERYWLSVKHIFNFKYHTMQKTH